MNMENERNNFNMNKRKNITTLYAVLIALVFIAMLAVFTQGSKKSNASKVYTLTESSKVDYKVYLKDNEFFKDSYLGKDNQYIASLIDYIDVDFNYNLDSMTKDISYKYKYKILAEVEVKDKNSKNVLYNVSDEIVSEKEYNANTNETLELNNNVKVDYNKYNDLINKFVQVYDLDDYEADLIVNMYVTMVDSEGIVNSENSLTPVTTVLIPLTTKTMAIDIESNTVNGNDISVYKASDAKEYLLVVMGLLLVDFVLIRKLTRFRKDTENEKSLYNMKLRKIMMSYSSYIQKIGNEYEFGNRQILDVKVFEDLLQIRETINRPILMTETEDAMGTYFFIVTEDVVYIYELKAGNLKQKRGRRYKAKEEHPENKEEV